LKTPNAEIRIHGVTLYNSIYGADQDVLVNQHAYGIAPNDAPALAAQVRRARLDYQACLYSKAGTYLPCLLARLGSASAVLEGDDRLRVHALAADAYHVAAGLLLKHDDHGLAIITMP
jgi:hypothetical protein